MYEKPNPSNESRLPKENDSGIEFIDWKPKNPKDPFFRDITSVGGRCFQFLFCILFPIVYFSFIFLVGSISRVSNDMFATEHLVAFLISSNGVFWFLPMWLVALICAFVGCCSPSKLENPWIQLGIYAGCFFAFQYGFLYLMNVGFVYGTFLVIGSLIVGVLYWAGLRLMVEIVRRLVGSKFSVKKILGIILVISIGCFCVSGLIQADRSFRLLPVFFLFVSIFLTAPVLNMFGYLLLVASIPNRREEPKGVAFLAGVGGFCAYYLLAWFLTARALSELIG